MVKLLSDLQGHKAHGPDGIPARLLKETAYSMAPLLTHIYKASLHQRKLPHDWKTALVSPIYKKGSRKSFENYRPISLTSIPCKILEHLIYSSVYRKQQKFHGTKLSRFSRIFNKTQKFSLLILGYGTS